MLRPILVAVVVSLMTTVPAGPVNFIVRQPIEALFVEDARNILTSFNREYTTWKNKQVLAEWNYATNMTDENQKVRMLMTRIPELVRQIGRDTDFFAWEELEDEYLKRQLKKISKFNVKFPIDESKYTKDGFDTLMSSISKMEQIYNTVRICEYVRKKARCNLTLDEIRSIMIHSRNPEMLKHTWVEWRKDASSYMKYYYSQYVVHATIEARRKYYPNQAAYWISDYEVKDFPEQIENLWQQLKQLYLQLHAYVRRELRKKYGENVVSKDGPIPAHLLDNPNWSHIADFTVPFPGKQIPDVTRALREQDYNARSIFRLAERFFKSINLSAMTDTFWEKSVLERPENVKMNCDPMSFDFYDGKDFRIKQCTRIDMKNLYNAHHEMARIQYYMQFKDQPPLFKEAANSGFHEAIGDLISLSVSTPGYLKKVGLLENDYLNDPEASLNHLYLMSLEKIAFLPFVYTVDLWRWDVFQGKVTTNHYNCHWWSLVEQYQGIEPPVDRTYEDFDPSVIQPIIEDVEYIRYYVSSVIQFQFHKALCIKARQYDPSNPDANPLHKCDIYGNKDAGNLLKSMMELGSSKPWPDAMEKITDQRQMDAAALLEYFQPLMNWLTEENKRTNEYIGWKPSNKRCVKINEELFTVSYSEIDDEL